MNDRPDIPPARTTPAIPIFHDPGLAPAAVAFQLRPPADSITMVVKATFDLVPGGPARPRKEPDPLAGDAHLDDDLEKSLRYASDFAFFKPKADITVVGHAVATSPAQRAARVSLRFGAGKGRVERAIHVLGDRVWQRALGVSIAPTDPAPFDSIPLVYERAFGGPSSSENPLGTGASTLPNLEDPDRPIKGPSDTPKPACFAPVPATFASRASRLGTYDGRWLATRWPYFPEDFDWAYFQSAPLGQQTDHLAGDEPFEITGMRRDHPVVQGTLPGRRVQAFLHKTREAGGSIEELLLRLDTAAFDLDGMKVNLVWRGLTEVSDDEAPEIAAILVVTSALSEPPMTLERARERLHREWTPKEPVVLDEPEPAPQNDVDEEPEREDPELARIEAELAEREKTILDELRASGVDVDAEPEPPPPLNPKEIADRLRAAGLSEEEASALEEALSNKDEPEPEPEPEPGLREKVMAMLASGEPFDGVDLSGGDLSDLDFSGRSMIGILLARAKLQRCLLQGANLEGAQLGSADLEGADLGGARLVGADLTGTKVTGARFEGADLEGADLSKAEGRGADFRRARGAHASFAAARLPGASFAAAWLPSVDFTRAVLDKATFEDAEMPEARLYDVTCEGGRLDRVKMPGARADGAFLVQCLLRSADIGASEWEGATLDGSSFAGSDMAGAGLSRTSSVGSVFSGCDLREARFRRAKLATAKLVKADLMKATFERADLTKADLRGANLHGAEVWKATLEGADLDLAILTQSKLQGRRR